MLERLFQLKAHGTTVRTELLAGLTSFLTMAYIVFVNPDILSAAGMPKDAVFVATCLAAAIGSGIMGLYANYPVAVAPAMGLNAYFAFTVVQGMGYTWQTALGAVFISGMLFITISLFKVREWIVNAIPTSLKYSISAGIGLFLAIIGLKNAGLITAHPATSLTLGDLHTPGPLLASAGFMLIVALEYRKVPGAIIIAILTVTSVSAALGLSEFHGVVAAPPSLAPTFLQMDLAGALNAGLLAVVLTFFMVELFDASGTLIGVCHRAGLLDQNGRLPRLKKSLARRLTGDHRRRLPGHLVHHRLHRIGSGHRSRWPHRVDRRRRRPAVPGRRHLCPVGQHRPSLRYGPGAVLRRHPDVARTG